ncbi:MAG TPA: hypothetical protein VF746_23530 [Longimicrobium sp.]|jgi:hypothetical protein
MKLLAGILLAASLAAPAKLLACSCVGPRDEVEAMGRAHAVFAGRVASARVVRGAHGLPERVVAFTVHRWLKGGRGRTVVVRTWLGGGDCGVPFRVGRTYRVHARHREDGRLWTSLCMEPFPSLSRLRAGRGARLAAARNASAAPSCPG